MRCLILTTLLLTLPGCSIENPLFGVSGDTPSSSEADAASAALTDEPVTTTAEPTAATSVTTGDEPTTTSVEPATTGSEPGTTAIDPGTTTGPMSGTSGPVDGSSTGVEPEPPLCPAKNDAFAPYLLVNGQPLAMCPGTDIYLKGKLAIGDPLLISSGLACGGTDDDVYTLGTGMALAAQPVTKCLKTYLRLVDTEEGCKIALIKSYDPEQNPAPDYIIAAFSAYADALPIKPQANNASYCGCADPNSEGPDCCTGLDPGELVLLPTNNLNIIVEQFSHATVTLFDGGPQFEFHNLQSWVDTDCINNPEAGHHIDWIAVLKQ
jgi:hypothetical protein